MRSLGVLDLIEEVYSVPVDLDGVCLRRSVAVKEAMGAEGLFLGLDGVVVEKGLVFIDHLVKDTGGVASIAEYAGAFRAWVYVNKMFPVVVSGMVDADVVDNYRQFEKQLMEFVSRTRREGQVGSDTLVDLKSMSRRIRDGKMEVRWSRGEVVDVEAEILLVDGGE